MKTPESRGKDAAQVTQMIWWGLTASQGLYAFTLWQNLSKQMDSPNVPPIPFAAPAAVIAVVSLALFWSKLTSAAVDRAVAARPDLTLGGAFVWYILCWALNEAVVLTGFVQASFFSKSFDDFLPFLGAGLALNALMYPKKRPSAVT